MSILFSARLLRRPSLAFVLFCSLLAVLWIAGGATRSDVFGQVLVRLAAVIALFVFALFGNPSSLAQARPIWWILFATIGLAVLQLIPLPPEIWQALPGRTLFAEAMLGQAQPWRPLAIVPGTTINALVALVVPLATLCLATSIRSDERTVIPGVILAMIAASNFLALVQFSGGGLNNPFVNSSATEISGLFANRNHFALFLALGCLLVPAWVFADGYRSHGRALIGLGMTLLFLLTILATGSRSGILLGAVALGASILIARESIGRALRRAPRWALPVVIVAVVVLITVVVLISIAADRAVSIQRAFDVDVGQDMRHRSLPTVWAMTLDYFPFGAGLGSFDPMFRIHEPLELLKPTYFNHAHNDFLEIVLDSGLLGLLVLAAGLVWWVWASLRVWLPGRMPLEVGRSGSQENLLLPRIGSAMLLLIVIASAFDYPARTPMMMALIVISALWLHPPRTPTA